MKIIKLKRVKLGNEYPIVRVMFRNFWGRVFEKDAIKSHKLSEGDYLWEWMDGSGIAYNTNILNRFHNSGEYSYTIHQ